MKLKLIISILILLNAQAYSQFGPQQIISENAFGYPKIITSDLDNDGDLDILLAGQRDISWYENINGLGLFGGKQIITEMDWEFANTVSASDLDGDGDMDILSSFSGEGPGVSKIAWNKNLDGEGNFGPQQIISTDIISVFTIIGTDLDNDLDSDVLIIERNEDRVAWYENLDGLGNFGPKTTISTALNWPITGAVADIDNDGDIDILSAGYDGNRIGWFENINGQGSYSGLKTITTEVDAPIQLFAADLDMDDDLDVISTSLNDNKIAWYQNVDGEGNFGSQMVISQEVISPINLFVEDLDNDGDLDILSSHNDNGIYQIVWLENLDGNGNFSTPILISDEISYATTVNASDLDNDGDFDILSASQFDHKIAWYENMVILNSPDFYRLNSHLFPNPFDNVVYINSDLNVKSIRIIDQTGRIVKSELYDGKIDTNDLRSGVYFFEIVQENGEFDFHKMIRN